MTLTFTIYGYSEYFKKYKEVKSLKAKLVLGTCTINKYQQDTCRNSGYECLSLHLGNVIESRKENTE